MSSFVELRNRGKRAVAKVGMAIMIVIALFGSKLLQAQTVTEGLYYIASRDYNVSNTTTNYYLCPTENWNFFHGSFGYTSTDNGQPFMTTYQCRNGVYDSKKALWVVKQSSTPGWFYIIHLVDGKYLTYNNQMPSGDMGRMRIHLESTDDGDNALFQLISGGPGGSYSFCTKNGGTRKYVNVTGAKGGNGNQPSLQATNARSDGPGGMNVGGIIGLWTGDAANDNNSKWFPESILLSAPTINDVDPSTNKVTVSDNNGLTGYNIRYTTDGNDPDANSDIMPSDGYFVQITGTIKVVLEKFGVVITSVASKYVEPLIPADPTFATSCDNRVSITCPNMSDVNIYYTITNDGSEPADPTSGSTLYSSPIQYTATTRIKAKAILSGESGSEISSRTFSSSDVHTAAPTITISGSTVTIIASGKIYYTENGSEPTTALSEHNSPVNINVDPSQEVNIHAIAKAVGEQASCVSRLLCPSAPSMTVTDGDCSSSSEANKVTITAPDDGRTLWYTYTPGENSAAPDPDETAYIRYTAPVSLNSIDGSNTHYTIHAYALSSDGQFRSVIVSESHLMKASGKPELTTPRGSNPVVHIAGGVFGDVAECRVDNGTPDNSGDDVTINLPLASDGTADFRIQPNYVGTLTVKFTHGSWQPSCETSFALADAPETPTYSLDCANILSLACNTPMADIHYTINESQVNAMDPTLDSPTYTPGCFDALEDDKYICAKAFVGYRASVRLGFLYHKTHSKVPQFFVDGTTVQITGQPGTHLYYTKSEGTVAGVAPTDPANPDIATPPAGQVHVTSNTTNITIAGNNIITVFKVIAVPDGQPENASCMSRVVTREGYSITQASHLDRLAEHPNSYFFVFSDIDIEAGAYPTNTVESFAGVLDGNYHTISGLTRPLFNTISSSDETHNAAVLNLMLKGVDISTNGNAGAIANTASGYTRIYNCGILPTEVTYREDGSILGFTGSSVGGGSNGKVGGLVGELNGTARVINCFSYANITSGKYRAGIVGYNDVASTSGNLQTMIMNCMFYGDISTSGSPTKIAPVYGGEIIHNKRAANDNTGLNNYCYFYYNGDYVDHIGDDQYHGSLGAEERFLNRFEFFRQTLNSTRNMAAFYVYGSVAEKNLIAKWVLDKNIAPYPVLKQHGYYPSVINPDAEHAVAIDPDNKNYNQGRKLGTLTVNIRKGSGGAIFNNDDGSAITTSTLTLNITDKDPDNFNFNYKKVQLPYYHQVGTGNYSNYRVVTGWKIVEINGSTTGTGTFYDSGADYPAFNFADRSCSNKDLYSVSGRVWNQGAYWEVPDGVSSITIEPYWAKAEYLSDAYYDETYNGTTKYGVTVAGNCTTSFNGQTVRTAMTGSGSAIESLGIVAEKTVYDYAVVLVGNYHQYATASIFSNTNNSAVTIMSADLDEDCEPDNSLLYYHSARQRVAPIRFDFLNMPGVGMVKRTHDSDVKPEPGIFKPSGWFEVTNTVNLYCGQFEYCDNDNTKEKMGKLFKAPLILLGGVYEQFVSSHEDGDSPDMTDYIHVGGNAWFKNFANGCHTNKEHKSHNMPITVTGGDYDHFYLTGIYRPNVIPYAENAECYIDGGRFGDVAGAGIQKIDGDVTWEVNAADIDRFFGGGINAASPITGNITTTISNSRVAEYYGGPKFGEVQEGKLVTTTATDCTFGLFFGAGYGGTALNKVDKEDKSSAVNTYGWNAWVDQYYDRRYDGAAGRKGIATSYEYEYILHSDGNQTVGRFYINYASLSLASTRDVTTSLTGCKIGKFYGGGRLGAVKGNVVSTLTDCIVETDAFGSGFSAESPKATVFNIDYLTPNPKYNRKAGVFNNNIVQNPPSVEYTWKHANQVSAGHEFDENGGHYILTTENLDNLGAVVGNATLTIQGSNTVVKGDVYGGGAKSNANTGNVGGKCTVNILGGTFGVKDGSTVSGGNIYGGGMGDLASLVTTEDPEHKDVAVTEDEVEVNIGSSEQDANSVVIYGSVYGCNNINGTPQGNATVHVWKTKHDADNVVTNLTGGHAISEVFGGGNKASYRPSLSSNKALVHVHNCDNTIKYVYGGGNAADVGASNGVKSSANVIIDGGRIEWLFGGGNGAGNNNPGANIYDDVNVSYHAGDVTYFFGGSNEQGVIGGSKNVEILNDNSCSITNHIAEFYGGNNKAPITGNVGATLTMPCTQNPCKIDYLFGGSRMADISGNVTLTVYGGLYDYVFGGNNLGGIIDGNVTLNLYGGTINQAAFGGNKGGPGQQEYDYFKIIGDITVNVEDHCPDCPLQVNNVFGAGDQASYIAPTGEGAREHNPMVNVKNLCSDKTITGNVYGGGNGLASDLSQMTGSVTGKPMVTIGDVTEGHEDYRAAISGNVFGGGNAAKVVGNTEVLMQKSSSSVGGDIYGGGALANTGSTTVTLDGGTVTQDIYGGGLGDNTHAAVVDGTAQVTVNGGTVRDVFGCNNLNGAPTGAVVVDINSNVARNVYGGGNQAPYAGVPDVNINSGVVSGSVFGGGNKAGVAGGDVTMIGGQVLTGIYGGCNYSGTVSGDIAVNINAGTVGADADHKANIHGGGYGPSTETTGDVVVNIAQADAVEGPIIWGDVYGGSALGNVNAADKHTTVTLNKGTINGDIYGGGLGDNTNAAAVNGAVQVTVNSGTVAGSVYGCNNVNGAPQSTVKVDIYGTDAPLSGYALGHVFGGGNQAAYSGTPVVKVHNCNNSIEYVYGGGNAANVLATDVTIYGGNTIGNVFGGCYGANVTSGGTNVKIHGGTIAKVFGGNNQSGTIAGDILVNVDKQAEGSDPACAMKIDELYGGGNVAASSHGTITIGCTGTLVDLGNNEHYGVVQEGIHYVYGGANAANITDGITLNITSGIVENVFGGNNASGSISGTIQVNINKNDGAACAADWYVGNVFGAGNLAAYTGNPTVNITKGHVSNDVYGGGLGSTAVVTGAPVVTINGGSVGNDVFGGGSEAAVNGATHVIVSSGSVGQDVYGGGALANTGATMVDIMGGTISGDIYGGGLGDNTHAPTENGAVTVNIGNGTPSTAQNGEDGTNFTGNATIGGSVYGCNNNAGSPQDNVTVNIYRTAHTELDALEGTEYAIANVFGGGNRANYAPDVLGKKAMVNIYGCYNTIDRVFGGGNAAATPQVETDIQGGRLRQVFGGGNGEVTAANINGDVTLKIHGGYVEQFYGASNQQGTISGDITTPVDDQGPCGSLNIVEFFCGGNFADVGHSITATISCSDNKHVRYLYGGCNQANVAGNVQLNLYGGTYEYVFGGSKGRLAYPSTLHPEYTDINHQEAKSADITGSVTLNLYGGTITNVFGGSNVNGNIDGTITVNVIDVEDPACPLYITNIYGGSNLTSYTPTNSSVVSPVVNVVHAKYGISGNVYGGSKGEEGFTTNVNANPRVNIGYDATSMDAYIPSEYITGYSALLSSPRAIISGNVFGGGDAARVVGNTAIYLRNSAKVFRNVYGGGNMGEVTGNTKVIVNDANE